MLQKKPQLWRIQQGHRSVTFVRLCLLLKRELFTDSTVRAWDKMARSSHSHSHCMYWLIHKTWGCFLRAPSCFLLPHWKTLPTCPQGKRGKAGVRGARGDRGPKVGYMETSFVYIFFNYDVCVDSRLCFVIQGQKGDTGPVGLSGWPGLIVSQFICPLNVCFYVVDEHILTFSLFSNLSCWRRDQLRN